MLKGAEEEKQNGERKDLKKKKKKKRRPTGREAEFCSLIGCHSEGVR